MIMVYFSSFSPLIWRVLTLFLISCSLYAESLDNPPATVYGGRTWKNNIQSLHFLTPSLYRDSLVRPILLSSNISYNDMNLQFGCGFFCFGSPCDTGYLFAVFFVVYGLDGNLLDMQMVWSSNRDQMVEENATLTLIFTGELVLKSLDGNLVWSTNTSTQAFERMEIQESGNLVLYNTSGEIIWQSFDYPTDTMLRGQKLKVGQKIIANTSPKNTSQGLFYYTLLHDSFAMFTATAPAKMYLRYPTQPAGVEISYMQFDNQSVNIYTQGGRSPLKNFTVPSSCLYFKIDSDGHLKDYSMLTTGRSSPDYFPSFIKSAAECDYPRPCGDYSVCTNGECSCPRDGNAFKPINAAEINEGCAPRVPLACSENRIPQDHHFLEVEHVSYFTYNYENSSTPGLVSRDACKNLCLQNCSCRAAFFRYGANSSIGYCYLESTIYSMKANSPVDYFYNSTAYIKIQSSSKRIMSLAVVIICASAGGALALFVLLWAWTKKSQNRRHQKEKDQDDGDDGHVDWPSRLPLRFSFDELQDATNGFSMRLGRGGFGSVYEGVLADGSKIAVKRLDRAGQGKREFRAEVETLGKIDHLNLVRLKGFCAEKAHRMLVYEHLLNGSLDKWIFPSNTHQHLLDWKTRYKVVLNIARGLMYLHEECQECILHFDIKPQNILLYQNFNAKVSDFGLAKLMNRDQNEVITMMRGTPGYMAPELLNIHFTEKADTFSFGVMVIEIVSGKRSRELSEDGLFSLLKVKAEEGRLIDLVYPGIEYEETGIKEEAVKVLKMGMWCVQENFTRRPAMSIVVKALEGLIDMFNDVPCVLAGQQLLLFNGLLSRLSCPMLQRFPCYLDLDEFFWEEIFSFY